MRQLLTGLVKHAQAIQRRDAEGMERVINEIDMKIVGIRWVVVEDDKTSSLEKNKKNAKLMGVRHLSSMDALPQGLNASKILHSFTQIWSSKE